MKKSTKSREGKAIGLKRILILKCGKKDQLLCAAVATQGLPGITDSVLLVLLRTCFGALLPEVLSADRQVFMHVLHHCVGHLITQWRINCSTVEKT